jgi:hypothetical protein
MAGIIRPRAPRSGDDVLITFFEETASGELIEQYGGPLGAAKGEIGRHEDRHLLAEPAEQVEEQLAPKSKGLKIRLQETG